MGLFDFPRIHFRGNLDINVPTINNAYYFPLTIYDSMRSLPFLPPRLYFETEQQVRDVGSQLNPTIYNDAFNGYVYIEIETVQDIPTLRKWLQAPILANNPMDELNRDYIPFYHKAEQVWEDSEGTTIVGNAMGYWNMWGDMGVRLSEVKVCGVQTYENEKVTTYTADTPQVPADIQPFIGAGFDLDTYPASGRTTASMVETLSSQSVYANIFCSNVNLYNADNPEEIFLQGKPYRFAAGIYAAWRAIDWWPPMAGSARFVSSIPMSDLNTSDSKAIVDFFNKYGAYDARPLQGIFVTFQTFEVYENRYDQEIYQKNGTASNPAQAYTVGSICPWYLDDMKSTILGRQLINLNQESINLGHPGPLVFLIPVISNLKKINDNQAVFSMDFGNTWPEQIHPPFDKNNPPAKRGDASFTTYPLGRLSVRYGEDPGTEFFYIEVDDVNNPRKSVFEKGCVFDLVISDPQLIENIKNNFIRVYLTTATDPTSRPMLMESPYMIATDQKGCYGEEGDRPADGYQVYNENKEYCTLRILQKGEPVTEESPCIVYLAKWKVFEAANDPIKPAKISGPMSLIDNAIVDLAEGKEFLDMNDNAINFFVYSTQYPWIPDQGIQVPPFNSDARGYTIMDTGSFVCLRVHQNKDQEYAPYYNPANWNTTPPDFNFVYEEVFKLYDVVYPIMAEIHPFTEEVWNNGTMSGLVLQRTNPSLWNDILYMPKSRELSRSQRKLLQAWDQYIKQQGSKSSEYMELSAKTNQELVLSVEEVGLENPIPGIHSGCWARHGNKLLVIGGRTEGFHGLIGRDKIFKSSKANDNIQVVDLDYMTYTQFKIPEDDPHYLQFTSSNAQFCQVKDELFIAGGYGRKIPSDPTSNTTIDKFVGIQVSQMITLLETGKNPTDAVTLEIQSPFVQVTGGEMFFEDGTFHIAFGQDYPTQYQVGITGKYTEAVKSFQVSGNTLINTNENVQSFLHRRDLNVEKVISNPDLPLYAGYGGVFNKDNNGYGNPVYIYPNGTSTAVFNNPTLDQITNQYKCALASIYDQFNNINVHFLIGGIGRYQYNTETNSWEDGDNGALLPFVKTITKMKWVGNELSISYQVPPNLPELPARIGANGIFFPLKQFLYKDNVIDQSKLNPGSTVVGYMFGGIVSQKATSSEIYPSHINDKLYRVILSFSDGAVT